jgi:hypothetical protein
MQERDWGCSSVGECLPSMCEALNSIPSIAKKYGEINIFPNKESLKEFISSPTCPLICDKGNPSV